MTKRYRDRQRLRTTVTVEYIEELFDIPSDYYITNVEFHAARNLISFYMQRATDNGTGIPEGQESADANSIVEGLVKPPIPAKYERIAAEMEEINSTKELTEDDSGQ